MEYVKFDNKKWNYAGDKATWVRTDGRKFQVKKAAKGIISREYTDELREYCQKIGVDFDSIRCGDMITVER